MPLAECLKLAIANTPRRLKLVFSYRYEPIEQNEKVDWEEIACHQSRKHKAPSYVTQEVEDGGKVELRLTTYIGRY
jgi:hypothetical protein